MTLRLVNVSVNDMGNLHKKAAKSAEELHRHLRKTALIFLVAAAVSFLVSRTTWLAALLLVFAAYFFLRSLQYRNLRGRHLIEAKAPQNPTVDEEVEPYYYRDIAIDGMGEIRVCDYSDAETESRCYQKIVESIVSDPELFHHKFEQMLSVGKERYPEWAEEISGIELTRLEIFRGKRCVASAEFKGEQREFFGGEYDGVTFSGFYVKG